MGLARVDRGQLVLVAAAVVAVALTPVLFAYLQLGYHPDVSTERQPTGERAVAFLDRSVHDAAAATAGDYEWDERTRMADAMRDELAGDIETLAESRIEAGISHMVEYNRTAALAWQVENCRRGDGRRFGACETDRSIVLQERAGEAVFLAVAFDVRIVGPDGEAELTVVVAFGSMVREYS